MIISRTASFLAACLVAGFVFCESAVIPAFAETLTIGLAAEPTSVDPHYHGIASNYNLAQHIFDRLVDLDENMAPKPALATAWRKIDDNTWEFDLRKGVSFHDGTPFTAADVAFTFERAMNVPGSPSSLSGYIGGMKVEVIDDYKIRIHTKASDPLVPGEISAIAIVSKKDGENATTADYNAGRAAIGTGPYKFVEWTQGVQMVLERNPDYWGPKPEWDRVIMKYIPSGPARIAALLSHSVDIIDNVPTTDIKRIQQNPDFSVETAPANRMIYLSLDQFREQSPYVSGVNGEKIKNPFMDLRVRQAVSKAIDRDALVDLIMDGAATPAGQFVQPVLFGSAPNLKPDTYDPDEAKKLLATAGYPQGFAVTIHGPDGVYANDAKALEAIGQMLSAVGIQTKVETMSGGVFATRAAVGGPDKTPEFSLFLWGHGGQTGDASSPLTFLIHTPAKGIGGANRGRFSNAEIDQIIDKAISAIDDETRRKLLEQATELSVDQLAIIPLYYLKNVYAMRKGLTYDASIDERMLAFKVIKQ